MGSIHKNLFTLVEMLVVIAVIGLLAGMIFPVLAKIRKKSNQTYCLNNLHQIGILVTGYSGENDGFLPTAKRLGDSPDDNLAIQNLLPGKTRDLYRCPADNRSMYSGKTFFIEYGSSYEWNTWLNGLRIDFKNPSIFMAEEPLPLMWEANNFHNSGRINFLFPGGNVGQR